MAEEAAHLFHVALPGAALKGASYDARRTDTPEQMTRSQSAISIVSCLLSCRHVGAGKATAAVVGGVREEQMWVSPYFGIIHPDTRFFFLYP